MAAKPNFWSLLKETATEWLNDDPFRLGAALAYYTVFSLAPLLVILVGAVGFVWGNQSGVVRTRVLAEVQGFMGTSGRELIEGVLDNSSGPGSGNLWATTLGVLALLFGATTVFAQLQDALNTIWEVEPTAGGVKGLVTKRLLSFGVILMVGVLLTLLLIISAVLSALDSLLVGITPQTQLIIRGLELIGSFGILTLLFAMIYKYLPDVEIDWREVWTGAAITALLFTLGKYAIGAYLGETSAGSAYGTAGSLAVLLVWVYYSSIILFFGAEFTQVYARHYGTHIRPAHDAVRIGEERKEAAPPAPSQPAAPSSSSRWKRWGLVALAFWVGRFFGRRR